MKLFLAVAVLISSIAFTFNMQPVKADKAMVGNIENALTEKGKTFKVDTEKSMVGWVGTKPSGKHNGSIKISEGSLQVKKSVIKSGNFTINMTTITDLDLTGKGKDGLEGHLKNADFFDVAKFPNATFEITSVAPVTSGMNLLLEGATHTIGGNFTLKGVTQNISFPAVVKVDNGTLSATANFNIDRTLWGINYGADGKVGKEINLSLDITASK